MTPESRRSSNQATLVVARARDFLVLATGLAIVALLLAWLAGASLLSVRTYLVAYAVASAVAALGLFMTWVTAVTASGMPRRRSLS